MNDHNMCRLHCFSQFRTDVPFAALRAPPGAAALSWQLPFALLPAPSPSLGEQPIRVEEAGDNVSKHISVLKITKKFTITNNFTNITYTIQSLYMFMQFSLVFGSTCFECTTSTEPGHFVFPAEQRRSRRCGAAPWIVGGSSPSVASRVAF